ncbi:MAG: helix-turn-helix domain-containing protein [Lachnospiraceae bacterium]|nr:helix-turn-helix domain-containing protein [Lachnospiraceae bacterium]
MNTKRKPPPKHHSHLTFEDRVRIDEMLRRGDSFRSIAAVLGKTPSTISREVRNHTTVVPTRETDCIYLRECTKTKLCEKPGCNTKKCKTCTVPCKKHCTDYVQSVCEKLMDSPYVCNGCKRMYSCKLEHHIYNPKDAQKEYRSMLTDRRNGFDLTGEQLLCINEMVSPLITKGQSPYHIKQTLGDILPVSEATLRRMITNCELDVRNVDLRNVVSRKPRRKTNHKLHNETLSRLKIGHTYKDYLAYIAEHDVTAVQMDCVEGTKEDTAVLLTLHFPAFHMQLAYIMNEHTSAEVVHTLDMLEEALGTELFKQVFPIILTDNGHEFMDIAGMEHSINGG